MNDTTRVRHLYALERAAAALDPFCPEFKLRAQLAAMSLARPFPLDQMAAALETYVQHSEISEDF
jgi:hypothetical protein